MVPLAPLCCAIHCLLFVTHRGKFIYFSSLGRTKNYAAGILYTKYKPFALNRLCIPHICNVHCTQEKPRMLSNYSTSGSVDTIQSRLDVLLWTFVAVFRIASHATTHILRCLFFLLSNRKFCVWPLAAHVCCLHTVII